MIVVFDTNVYISALLTPSGPPGSLVNLWERGLFDVAITRPLIDELERVLKYPRINKLLLKNRISVQTYFRHIKEESILFQSGIILTDVVDDPDDNRVLECAVCSNAAYIISGDAHLLKIIEYQGIPILKPAEFLIALNTSGRLGY